MAFEHMNESGKHVGDALSIATVVGTLAQVLPSLAAIFTIIWTGIRIFETDTVQKLFGRKKVEDVKED